MSIDVSLDLYKIFCTVVKSGNMSSAAKELYISQPAVSMSIKQLEERFGKPLLIRSSKGITPTAEGSVIFEYLNQALDLIDTAEKKYMEMAHLEIGEVRIGANDTILNYYLLPYIKKFVESHQTITFKATNHTSGETVKMLKSGEVDIGFVNLPIDIDKNLDVIKCIDVEDCLIGGVKYKHLAKDGIHINELANLPILLLEKTSNTRKFLEKSIAQHGFILEPNIELGSNDLLIEFAKINLGVTFVTKQFSVNKIDNKTVFEIPLKEKLPKRSIGLVKLKNVALSYAATRFVNLLGIE